MAALGAAAKPAYQDEGLDFLAPLSYPGVGDDFASGRARMLPPAAYRSKAFADLEDRAIWSRSWLAVGLHEQIPLAGDLLPYTAGNHGFHVQRAPDGSLIGRFNKAQHGGCRTIPMQCQTGAKTKCSYTSCGYSRDRAVIAAAELQENLRFSHQYLGAQPERLLPVTVASWHSIIFANLDWHNTPSFAAQLSELPSLQPWFSEPLALVTDQWLEIAANWKLSTAAIAAAAFTDHATDTQANFLMQDGPLCVDGDSRQTRLIWLFPNLLLMLQSEQIICVIVQPSALGSSVLRTLILAPLGNAHAQQSTTELGANWLAQLRRQGQQAEQLQRQLSDLSHSPSAPCEDSPARYWFNQYLLRQLFNNTAGSQ